MSGFSAPNRPRTVTITFWSVIFLGTWNLGRALALGQQLELQKILNLQPDPRLRLAAAALFTGLFFTLGWQLWRKRPFTISAIPQPLPGTLCMKRPCGCCLLSRHAIGLCGCSPASF